jgi:HEPN domain-containing protein
MEQSANHYFKIATKKLQLANEELFRNGNSVDKKQVCLNAHTAIENYFKGFLAFHEIEPIDSSLSNLYEQCVAIDIHLQKIEIKDVICRHSNYSLFSKCEELDAITACFEAADNIDTYFRRINILN